MTNTPHLRPLGETLGTEALGIDLSKPLDDADFAWIAERFRRTPGAGVPRPESRRRRTRRLRPSLRHAAQARADQVPPRRKSGCLLAYQCGRGRQGGLVRRQACHRLAHRFDL